MLVRELKLKPNKKLEATLNEWLWCLTGVYNFAIKKIELNAKDRIYFSKLDFGNLLANHSDRMQIPSHTIQATLMIAYTAWQRCFKKLAGKPKLKGAHNKLRSIVFPDAIPVSRFAGNKVRLPGIGGIKYFKQELPAGKIKQGRLVKRASGWHLQLTIDTTHTFKVCDTDKKVGIDTGFKHLAVLSDGTKYANQRNLIRAQDRVAQAQRGNRKQLVARLHERVSNRRKDYNHKVSREIVHHYAEVYITNDHLVGQAKRFGKSIGDAGISQLRRFIAYKSDNHGRKCVLVDSRYTTMTCSICGSRSGPTGLSGLAVRSWVCTDCGSVHDRDVNSAMVILKTGLGASHEVFHV
jgi:putative transposase